MALNERELTQFQRFLLNQPLVRDLTSEREKREH